jgi:hypothetical protein
MDEVRWAHTAVADLQTKVRTAAVRRYLLRVSQTALDRHPGEWGGRLDNEMWWHRGVAPDDEADPDGIPGCAVDGEMPFDYVLVYLRPAAARTPRSILVIRVLTNAELVAGLSGGAAVGNGQAHGVPARPPRGRRLTRPRGGGAGDRR